MATLPELPAAPSPDDPLGMATPEARYADALGRWMVKTGKVKLPAAAPEQPFSSERLWTVPTPVPGAEPTPAPADPLPPTRAESYREATRAKRRRRGR